MRRHRKVRRAAALGLCLIGPGLSGCGGTQGFDASEPGFGTTLGNLVAFNKLKIGAAPPRKVEQEVGCPIIEVQAGTAAARTYASGEETNANVKYQYSMGDVVRECSRDGTQLVVKVGIAGRVLLGPAGAPGSFTAPVRITVRNDNTQKPEASKFYQVPVTIQPGGSQADFNLVSDPIEVPLLKRQADEDYTILVGFDPKGEPVAKPAAARRRKSG